MIYCGTGHRPDKLGGYNDEAFTRLVRIAHEHLTFLAHSDVIEVISGMAQGWDQALAQAAADLGIKYIAALPFEGQADPWPPEARKRWEHLCNRSSHLYILGTGEYRPEMMQIRNEWMVNNSNHVLAMYDGTAGGTRNCIRYANRLGRSITNLYPKYLAAATKGPLDEI